MLRFPLYSVWVRISIICAIVWMVAGQAYAQKKPTEDVIYLKNGSIIRGSIVEQKVGEGIRIQILGGSEFQYAESEIDKITIEPVLYRSITLKLRKEFVPITYRKRGLYHLISFDLGWAEDEWGIFATSNIRYRAGYHLQKHLAVGIGGGFDFYEEGAMILPVFLDVRGDVFQKPLTPHYVLNIGYGFAGARGWNMDRFRGGMNGQLGGGFKLHTRRNYEWMFTGGFRFQQSYQEFNVWRDNLPEPILVTGNLRYNRIYFELGFGF